MNVTVLKRNGSMQDWDSTRISRAVLKACEETGIVEIKAVEIANAVVSHVETMIQATGNIKVTVMAIQAMIEDFMFNTYHPQLGINYRDYRKGQDKARLSRTKSILLTDEFISKYKHIDTPMTRLGEAVYFRTYSRFLEDQQRREYWWETVKRAVEYNCSLVDTTKEEAEKLFDNIFNLRQFLSGRTLWVGGTPVASKFPMANYNCSFHILNRIQSFRDAMYLLLVGVGVGMRATFEDALLMPKFRADVLLKQMPYEYLGKGNDIELSYMIVRGSTAIVIVGDSKEGWAMALDMYLAILTDPMYRGINTVEMHYNAVRPKGHKLMTFGGTASGHLALQEMFAEISVVVNRTPDKHIKLKPIDLLDIANIVGSKVVVGGVRRTAEMVLFDASDKTVFNAKSNLYVYNNGKYEIDSTIAHRQMSNNSVAYYSKPSRLDFKAHLQTMRRSGEPAWVNYEAGKKRRADFEGVNPCGEILLGNKGLCNLTTVNVFAFVDEKGILDIEGLLEAQRLSARSSYRLTTVELELPEWDAERRKAVVVGCSLTGWMDMIGATGMNRFDEIKLLEKLREVATEACNSYAEELGMLKPILVTTVKPEGTLSQLPTVSSGVHYSHSPFYIRRLRINSHDAVAKTLESLGYPVQPEVGQGTLEECSTKVFEFPVKAFKGNPKHFKTKYDVSAIEQLENYLMFMRHYVDHNASITVHVREDEWDAVEQWVWENWDEVVAISFLPLDDSFYQLMPYEAITEAEYEARLKVLKPFSQTLLTQFEASSIMDDLLTDAECQNNVCPIR